MVKAIIFDLDDTLYNEIEYVKQGFRNVARYLTTEAVCKSSRIPEEELYERMCQILSEQGRGKIFDTICKEWEFDIPVKDLVAVYRDTKPQLSLYKDAEELIAYLKNSRKKLGIITDGCSQVQHRKIDALPLKQSFDVILATDDLGKATDGKPYCKPNPEVYEYVLERLGCTPREAMYIGDNPQKDFIGAKGLGMKTIRIIRENGDHMQDKVDAEYEADTSVHDLRDIKQIMELL